MSAYGYIANQCLMERLHAENFVSTDADVRLVYRQYKRNINNTAHVFLNNGN